MQTHQHCGCSSLIYSSQKDYSNCTSTFRQAWLVLLHFNKVRHPRWHVLLSLLGRAIQVSADVSWWFSQLVNVDWLKPTQDQACWRVAWPSLKNPVHVPVPLYQKYITYITCQALSTAPRDHPSKVVLTCVTCQALFGPLYQSCTLYDTCQRHTTYSIICSSRDHSSKIPIQAMARVKPYVQLPWAPLTGCAKAFLSLPLIHILKLLCMMWYTSHVLLICVKKCSYRFLYGFCFICLVYFT